MANRLSKIYTKTGDQGETGLADGTRIDKTDARVMAMGDVDELNSLIGVLIAHDMVDNIAEQLQRIQHTLFNLGGELSLPGAELVLQKHVKSLEELIDKYNEDLPGLKEFILPGGSQAAAICHLARTVCRRAERSLLGLARTDAVNHNSQCYLNRLSDFLFVLARIIVRQAGGEEVYWQQDHT